MTAYTPTVRAALMAALNTPAHTLRRTRGGFVSSKPTQVAPISRRCANQLERDGLFEFDNPGFPSAMTLTREGLDAARLLQDTDQTKATRR
ncbi:hypothetical protein [Rhodanobacter sp. OR92]|uniref:hypothetical protein n=1 Tax=Rhodanobacter sp. OR92 TaxID=1076524 RepID=UPI000480222D|nr:hypothetical protein [Rhodanobacter sp. OR92]